MVRLHTACHAAPKKVWQFFAAARHVAGSAGGSYGNPVFKTCSHFCNFTQSGGTFYPLLGFAASFMGGDVKHTLPSYREGEQLGRATMAVSGMGAHFPQDIMLMGVRWDVA